MLIEVLVDQEGAEPSLERGRAECTTAMVPYIPCRYPVESTYVKDGQLTERALLRMPRAPTSLPSKLLCGRFELCDLKARLFS